MNKLKILRGNSSSFMWEMKAPVESYFVETICSMSEENVRRYIERQRNVQL